MAECLWGPIVLGKGPDFSRAINERSAVTISSLPQAKWSEAERQKKTASFYAPRSRYAQAFGGAESGLIKALDGTTKVKIIYLTQRHLKAQTRPMNRSGFSRRNGVPKCPFV